MIPPEQKVLAGQGAHGEPVDALPWYPGLQSHCLIEVLPSGEVAFSGHDSGGCTVAAPVLSAMAMNPSTVTPSLTTAA
jgi:hypothetical protein